MGQQESASLKSSNLGDSRGRSMSSVRTRDGNMVFVTLISKADVRSWFSQLGPSKDQEIGIETAEKFFGKLCRDLNIEDPEAIVEDVRDMISNVIKIHEFIQIFLLLTKEQRSLGNLEIDGELEQDEEESTSEASSEEISEEENTNNNNAPLNATNPEEADDQPLYVSRKMTKDELAVFNRVEQGLFFKKLRRQVRTLSTMRRTDAGKLEYIAYITKHNISAWFKECSPNDDGVASHQQVKECFEALGVVLKMKNFFEPLHEMLDYVPKIRFYDFLHLFLHMSKESRDVDMLEIGEELKEEEEDSTSEASSEELNDFGTTTDAADYSFIPDQSTVVEDLPMQIISTILSYLPPGKMLECLTVCKRWLKCAKKFPPDQWSTVHIYGMQRDDVKDFKSRHRYCTKLIFMRQFQEHLIEDVLHEYKATTTHLVLPVLPVPKVVTEMKKLEHLKVSGPIPTGFIETLSRKVRKLTYLNFSRVHQKSRHIEGLVNIAEMGKLNYLNLEGCQGEGLQYVLQNCSNLKSLNLSFVKISGIHCQLIGGNLFHLTSLSLRSTKVTDDGLYEIALGCRKLNHVFLDHCKDMGAQGVVDLIANCPDISVLKLAGCSQLRDNAVYALSSAYSLVELDVQEVGKVSSKAWRAIASRLQGIRIVHAWGCTITPEVLQRFHKRCIIYHNLTISTRKAEKEFKEENE